METCTWDAGPVENAKASITAKRTWGKKRTPKDEENEKAVRCGEKRRSYSKGSD